MRNAKIGKAIPVHPHAWLWEPLQSDPSFLLRSMFGTKAVYARGRLLFCFAARKEPFRGVLIATEKSHHASLMADFSALRPHPILPKWLYLPESADTFEQTAQRLVALARSHDPRLGVLPKRRKRGSRSVRIR